MAELTVRLNLSFGTRSLRCLMAAAMVFSVASEVASESVTLTTYYPAPSGVYAQMITTGNTYLARDTATNLGKVGVGTSSPGALMTLVNMDNTQSNILQVYPQNLTQGVALGYNYVREIGSNGNNAMLIDAQGAGALEFQTVGTGYVGVGVGPSFKLDVYDPGSNWAGHFASGGSVMYLSYGGGYGMYMDPGSAASGGTYAMYINLQNGGGPFEITGNGNVGIGMASSAQKLDVNGTARVGDIVPTNTGCTETNYAIDGVTACPGGQYATLTAGVISWKTMMPPYAQGAADAPSMLCCGCPASSAGCSNLGLP